MTEIIPTDKRDRIEQIIRDRDYPVVPEKKLFENAINYLRTLHIVAGKKPNKFVNVSDVTKNAHDWFIEKPNTYENEEILKYLEEAHKLITRIEDGLKTKIAITEKSIDVVGNSVK